MSADPSNLEHRTAAGLASNYLARGYVNSGKKAEQRANPADLPAIVRAELEYRYPHFEDDVIDGVMSWAHGAIYARDIMRQAMQQAAYSACGSADACLWDMDEAQRAQYLSLLDAVDVHKLQRAAGIPVDQIMACDKDDENCPSTRSANLAKE